MFTGDDERFMPKANRPRSAYRNEEKKPKVNSVKAGEALARSRFAQPKAKREGAGERSILAFTLGGKANCDFRSAVREKKNKKWPKWRTALGSAIGHHPSSHRARSSPISRQLSHWEKKKGHAQLLLNRTHGVQGRWQEG
jgi:hypothetical protein